MIASFGSAKGYNSHAFQISVERDINAPLPSSKVVRYGKLGEIHHIFKPDPKSPPIIVSLVFVVAVLAALPALIGVVSSLRNLSPSTNHSLTTSRNSGFTLEQTSAISLPH